MTHKLVLFLPHNARVENTDDPAPYLYRDDCVLDPDLSGVVGTPPHFWKLEEGRVLPMCDKERAERLELLSKIKAPSNVIEKMPHFWFSDKSRKAVSARWFFIGALVSTAINIAVGFLK